MSKYLPEHRHLVERFVRNVFQSSTSEAFRGLVVYDGVCGIGKTTDILNHIEGLISSNPDNRVIYVGQYLEELHRIAGTTADPAKPKSQPPIKDSKGKTKYNPDTQIEFEHPEKRKLLHLKDLINQNKNIVITHKLFESLDIACLALLKSKSYHLVIDEEPVMFELVADRYTIIFKKSKQKQKLSSKEIESLFTLNVLGLEKDKTTVVWKGPDLPRYQDLKEDIDNKRIVLYNHANKGQTDKILMWRQNPEIFESFKTAHVLTYLFKDNFLNAFLDIYEIPYIIKNLTEEEALDDTKLKPYHKCIHLDPLILNSKNFLKKFGNTRVFSSTWFDKYNKEYPVGSVNPLHTKLNTYYKKNLSFSRKPSKVNERLWTTIKRSRTRLVTNGITDPKLFVSYNKRATNAYIKSNHLAFVYNIFPNPLLTNYIRSMGIKAPVEDTYALSILIQWVFRSAVREGKDIDLFLPSQRMTDLLQLWMLDLKDLYEYCRYIRDNINDPILKNEDHAMAITSFDDFVTIYQPGLRHYKALPWLLSKFPVINHQPIKPKPSRKKAAKKHNRERLMVQKTERLKRK